MNFLMLRSGIVSESCLHWGSGGWTMVGRSYISRPICIKNWESHALIRVRWDWLQKCFGIVCKFIKNIWSTGHFISSGIGQVCSRTLNVLTEENSKIYDPFPVPLGKGCSKGRPENLFERENKRERRITLQIQFDFPRDRSRFSCFLSFF